jgi:DNA topoisomerase-1
VESPAKAKTIGKYLGPDYKVIASVGHIRDLPKSKFGIDIENNFEPQYENKKEKAALIKELKAAAKNCEKVYLATDPDREGEAISWHLAHVLGLDPGAPTRVTFNEITQSGVTDGMKHPRVIANNLVEAQQTRRILDRIVGYQLSPFLWKKVRKGLSAGRVQSVTVKLLVDREKEIEAFQPVEYWSVDAKFLPKTSKKSFLGKLIEVNGKKAALPNKAQTDAVLARLNDAAYEVTAVKKTERKNRSAPPFSTSTLQQEASKRLSYNSRKTMKTAQELYEGVDIAGYGTLGLITYMRTDSLRISEEARAEAKVVIEELYGKEYVPDKPKYYKTKSNAQDAHEAIRPSVPSLSPDRVKASLTSEQYKLYKLIWERFTASLMADAILDSTSIDITANDCVFRSSGYVVRFDGFMKVYSNIGEDESGEQATALPKLSKGDTVTLKELSGNQHFTEPPPRYTEASLIKALEENGIGRPSTYAPTISTILDRQYVERLQKALKPTILGVVITELLEERFPDIVETKFTAGMESDLDEVELGGKTRTDVLGGFYGGFAKTLAQAEEEMQGKRVKIPDEPTDFICDKCGKPMVIKVGPYGKFIGCSGFPECKNTMKIVVETGGFCPKCGSRMLQKKSKKGRSFFGCEKGKDCGFMTWDTPIPDKCPLCSKTLFKKGGKHGKIYCAAEECSYSIEA